MRNQCNYILFICMVENEVEIQQELEVRMELFQKDEVMMQCYFTSNTLINTIL